MTTHATQDGLDFTKKCNQILQWGGGSLSEICFDGSDDDLGMEDEDPYDPMGPLYQSDNEGIYHNMKISL